MRHLISLGDRCDVAFQLRMHGRENVAHFFDWLATPAAGLIKIIESDLDVFHPHHLAHRVDQSPHYVLDRVTLVHFYHQFPHYNGHVTPSILLFYDGFARKFRHLAQRFRDYVRHRPVTLVRQDISEQEALRLEQVFFQRYPAADAQFLYLVGKGEAYTTPHGHARVFDSPGSLGDPIAWSAMLRQEGLIDAPFRHSTREILHRADDDHNLSDTNRFSEAHLLAAVAANPCHAKFPLELAHLYRGQGRWDEAEDMALRSLSCAPDSGEAVFELVLTRWKSKKITAGEAAAAFVALADREPPQPSWLREAAIAFREAGLLDQAITYAQKSILAAPLDPEAHYQLGLCAMMRKDGALAEIALESALGLNGRHPYYHYTHSRILADAGRRAEAITAAEKAYDLIGGLFYLEHLARLLAGSGRRAEALELYRQALSRPDADVARIRKGIREIAGEEAAIPA